MNGLQTESDKPVEVIEEYGAGPAVMMLIDRAVAAYQHFLRVEGWAGNLAIHIGYESFGLKRPSANFKDRYGREGALSAASASRSTSLGCART